MVLIAVGVWLLLRQRRKKRHLAIHHTKEPDMGHKSEMDSRQQAPRRPMEMDASPANHELPAFEQKTVKSELP